MQYFKKVRESLQIIVKNLFFQLKNEIFQEIMKQNYTRLLPTEAKSIEFNKFLQYN